MTPLLDGVTRMRVWQAAPDRWRVDTLSDTGENDTYQAGANTFVWDSGEQLLTGIYGPRPSGCPAQPTSSLPPWPCGSSMRREPGAKAEHPAAAAGRRAERGGAGDHAGRPQSTIARADIWASPTTGLPLLVEVFDRGAAQPALETQFLQVGPWTPDAGVLTPQRGPGTGFTTTTPSDFSGVLKNLDDEVLPGSLAGLARQPSPVAADRRVRQRADHVRRAHLPPRYRRRGCSRDALDAGAAPLTLPRRRRARSRAPRCVNLVLVHPYRSPDTFLLVGLVSKTTLEQAAAVLAASQGPVTSRISRTSDDHDTGT